MATDRKVGHAHALELASSVLPMYTGTGSSSIKIHKYMYYLKIVFQDASFPVI